MKQKMCIFAANTQDGFGEHRDKNDPMCTIKYTAVFFMLWDYISAVTDFDINLIMGHVWIFQPYNNPNKNLTNNSKMGH